MAKSSISFAGVSSVALTVALLRSLESEGKTLDSDTLNSLVTEAGEQIAREESLSRSFDTRVKALVVDFFMKHGNIGISSDTVKKQIAMAYVNKYEANHPSQMEVFAETSERIAEFFKQNTGSARSENAKSNPKVGKDGKLKTVNTSAPSLADAFLHSRGPAGISLNPGHYPTMWSSKSCMAYQELFAQLAQVNNPDSEADSDSDSNSESVLA